MKRMKSKMGRPPLKEQDKRTAYVTVRLKENERKELEEDAKDVGLSLSSYLLKCWKETKE